MSWPGKSQIPLDQPNRCTPERLGALLANHSISGPMGNSLGLVPTKGHLKYSKPKLATEVHCPKAFASHSCGKETSFLTLKLSPPGSLMYVCTGLLLSLHIRNHMMLLCSLSSSNNPLLHNNVYFSNPPPPLHLNLPCVCPR